MKIEVKRAFLEGGVNGTAHKPGDVVNVPDELGRIVCASGKAEVSTKELTYKKEVAADTAKKGGAK